MECKRTTTVYWTSVICFLFVSAIISDKSLVSGTDPPRLDENGKIVWQSLEKITSNQSLELSDLSVPILVDWSQGYVDFVQNGLPYEYINDILKCVYDNSCDSDIDSVARKGVKSFIGIIMCILVGFLFILILPIVGFCFCCCRCCNLCGGKRTQRETKLMGCKRITFSLIMLGIIGILGSGMALSNTVNTYQSDCLDKSKDTLNTLTDGVVQFMNGAIGQIDYILTDEFGFVDQLIRDSLQDNELGTEVESYIMNNIGVAAVTSSLTTVSEDLTTTEAALMNVNDTRDDLISSRLTLSDSLTSVKTELQILDSTCSCVPPGYANLAVDADYNMLPYVTTNQLKIVESGKTEVDGLSSEISDSLNKINEEIETSTNQTTIDVIAALDEISNTTQDMLTEAKDLMKDVENTTKTVQKQYADIYGEYVEPYDEYRGYFFIGITCSILLILLFLIIALTIGTFSYKNVRPTERSRMSNAGGNIFIAGVFFTFLFAPIIMLFTMLFFAAFGTGSVICTPFRSLEAFEKTIDMKDVIIPGYYLGELIFGNPSYQVQLSESLRSCQRDDSLYTAFNLNYIINTSLINETLDDLETDLNELIADMGTIPLDFDVIPITLEDDLNNLILTIGLEQFNAAAYETILNEDIVQEQLIAYADDLDAAAAAIVNDTVTQEKLIRQADELRNIQTTLVEPMSESVASMNASVQTIKGMDYTLQLHVNDTIKAAYKVETNLNSVNTTQVAQNITEQYVLTLFGYSESFLLEAVNQLENDFANCKPVYEFYQGSLTYACDYLLGSWNAMWFVLGWCVFFYVPSIIFSVKLAKYYRIMVMEVPPKVKNRNHTSGSDEEVALNDIQGSYDHMQLVPPERRRGGMTPQINPRFIPDEQPIMAYEDYNGRPIAPPPAYNHGEHYSIQPSDYF